MHHQRLSVITWPRVGRRSSQGRNAADLNSACARVNTGSLLVYSSTSSVLYTSYILSTSGLRCRWHHQLQLSYSVSRLESSTGTFYRVPHQSLKSHSRTGHRRHIRCGSQGGWGHLGGHNRSSHLNDEKLGIWSCRWPCWTPYWTCLLGNGPMSFLVALMCSLPPKTWGKTPRSSNLS